jgi:hypothetical protein
MARAEISPGACGLKTLVTASMEGAGCVLSIESECEAVQKMAAELNYVEPFQEISFRKGTPKILKTGAKYCKHAACPVPVGIIKAVEVEAKLNLPRDVTIRISK